MAYAKELTKEMLIKMGIVDIDFDTLTVYGTNGPKTPVKSHNQKYLVISLYDLDESGNRIKLPYAYRRLNLNGTIYYNDSYTYKCKNIVLSRVLWAWKYGIAHEGMVIDHKNNKHEMLEDYRLENLQEITPAQNLAKERPNSNTRIVYRKKSIEYYEDKLTQAEIDYENAKLKGDADLVHKTRSMVSYFRACIRGILEKTGQNEQYDLQKD